MRKLSHLETFIKVVEANSLALAAKRLELSPAAISKQINALEGELKINLISRTTRRLELTELGRLYYERCKDVMKKIDDLDEVMNAFQQEPLGQLDVLASRHFADRCIIPHLQEFFAKYPKITLNLTVLAKASDLSREDIDLFFGISHPLPPEAVQQEISKGSFALCASPSYLAEYGVPKTPQDLSQHRFITYSVRESFHQLSFNNSSEIYLNPLLRVNDTKMMISCALQDLGFIKIHHLESEKYLSEGTLVEILAEFKEPPKPIYMGYFRDRYLQPKVRHFIEFYLGKLEEVGAYAP
ncbi:MAG: LysR family transcriptional regulator [Chlamydiae bacterium]|nr:LysR family transcriptional regulator [Chlamydiota bacterium]